MIVYRVLHGFHKAYKVIIGPVITWIVITITPVALYSLFKGPMKQQTVATKGANTDTRADKKKPVQNV